MKVDKGVCTNGTLEDLNRAIQFEAVFSTLVENKILAIKRECELKKRHKKSRLLRRILFGRKVSSGGAGVGSCCHREVSATNSNSSNDANAAGEPLCPGQNGTAGSAHHQLRDGVDVGFYSYGPTLPEASFAVENSTISDGVDEVIVEIGDLSSLVDADGNVVVRTASVEPGSYGEEANGPASESVAAGTRSRMSVAESVSTKSPESLETRRSSGRASVTAPRKSSLLEPVSIEIEPESDPLSAHYDMEDSATNVSIELDGVSDVSDMRRSIASEPISIIKNSTRSRYGQGSYLSAGNAVANRLRVLEAKSISAQNSPILPRQKPATEGRHLTFSTATYQQTKSSAKASAIDCDTSFVVDLSQSDRDQQQQQQQQQQQHNNSTVIVKDKPIGQAAGGSKKSALVLGDNSSSSSASKRNKLTQPHSAIVASIGRATAAQQQHQQQPQPEAPSSPPLGLIESFIQLTASNLPVIASTARHSPPVSDLVKLQQHHLTNTRQQQHRPSSPSILLDTFCRGEAHPSSDAHSPIPSRRASKGSAAVPTSADGVSATVSTGTLQPLPAGSAQPNQPTQAQRKPRSFLKQSSCDVELHYRPTVSGTRRSSAKEHHHHRKSSAYGHGDDYSSYIMGYDINESDEEKLNKRKYKYLKRCSDPVIVFPSTSSGTGAGVGGGPVGGSGLQHCILSRPPNQPLQFPYDEDFMYDVSLQIESERHGELDSIVPEHRRKHKHRHHHHHHRHCKKKRHKKRKILVHDLDDQSVKVIDPDDLPQRARWTIIATACLLLIMCLLLVGITLRMAPIIDDMVRQENERLMRESLDRAKMIKNYTEYNRMIGGDEIP
ncbi:uncharacterized protein LOC126561636 [Anopheles maculipalpis]|uniref:uncharacterized protein LOC126561636 n=1 Tax=Anopheles maculipalpis TaxID=1496333 RepID=UPI002158F838|nr:uncharacterized protein LOC126561636 [Anopheles maculipalpis]